MALITVAFGDENVDTHTIACQPFVVGRDASCDVAIDNLGLSRTHCQFVWEAGQFHIEDLKSANGTLLNGEKIEKAQIKDGDEIRIGKYKLLFHQAAGEAAPPSKEAAGGLAAMLEEAVKGEEKPPVTDSMKTFQLDAAVIRAEVQAATKRATDVAKSFGGDEPRAAGSSRSTLYIILGANAFLLLAIVAVLLILLLR